jgi:hypothetical protein
LAGREPPSRRALIESEAVLREGFDPPAWGATRRGSEADFDWNKLGGTPRFLQDEEWPEGDEWRFLAQFHCSPHRP